jgi:HD-GYP domain-containing protein (c-di-GMP phosphodiesterase class II)
MKRRKDFKEYLSHVAKQMILIHEADLLSKMVIRTVTRTLGVKYSGLFIYDKNSQEYIINVSSGKKGLKIPVGFAKIKSTRPIIRFFSDNNLLSDVKKDYLLASQIKTFKNKYKNDKKVIDFIYNLENDISLYHAQLIVPGFFRNNLLVVFFIGKKEDGKKFTKGEIDFLTVLSSDVVMAIENAKLFEDTKQQLEENKRLLLNTVEALANAIDIKNEYTHGHAERVTKYAMIISKYIPHHLKGAYQSFEDSLKIASLLHDIGKIGIPEDILNKPSSLTKAEMAMIKKHPAMGAEILEPINEFKIISLGVKYHHERYDGRGYPYNLLGDEIPLIASIISVADSYDAMSSDRPYRKTMKRNEIIKEIVNNKNKQFSPIVVDAFLKTISYNEI